MSRPPPQPPHAGTLALGEALDHSIELGQLMARLQASKQRFETIRKLLPAELQAAVRPGPLDENGWSLLAAMARSAASEKSAM